MQVDGYSKGTKISIDVRSIGGGHWLRRDAAAYFLLMSLAAQEFGLALVVNSSFRSHDKQKALYTAYQEQLALFIKKKRKTKPSIVASPGNSNHQSGVAVDINRAPGDNLATAEPDSPVDLWLKSNAASYGFKRTVASEPWHWEFDPSLLSI